jgi:hypothetical protein
LTLHCVVSGIETDSFLLRGKGISLKISSDYFTHNLDPQIGEKYVTFTHAERTAKSFFPLAVVFK